MAFCGKCGAKMEDGVKFCPACGAANETVAQQAAQQTPQAAPTPIQPQTQSQSTATDTDASQNKLMGILSYLGFLVLIPIFAAKESAFGRFHANQGLVLMLGEIAYVIVSQILYRILYAISWRLGYTISTILDLLYIGFAVFAVMGIINVVNERKKELPLIGGFKLLK